MLLPIQIDIMYDRNELKHRHQQNAYHSNTKFMCVF